ncbi:MAG: hypothetical protein E7507_03540 [Ruminococcus sp.]|nr:hypothetical protein [Ruminococcus sp.]
MRKKISDIIVGLLFVAVGVIVGGRLIFDWEFTFFYPGWWTIFIIVPCIISMINHGINFWNSFGVGAGIVLFMGANHIFFDMSESWKLLLPLVLVLMGLSIIFRKNNRGNYLEEQKNVRVVNGIPEFSAVFCGNEHTCSQGEVFNGANCSAVFGGVELRLRDAVITENVIINCSAVFGGVDIQLPPNVIVKVTSTPVFGGVDNKHTGNVNENSPVVYVNATCIFGGVDIV